LRSARWRGGSAEDGCCGWSEAEDLIHCDVFAADFQGRRGIGLGVVKRIGAAAFDVSENGRRLRWRRPEAAGGDRAEAGRPPRRRATSCCDGARFRRGAGCGPPMLARTRPEPAAVEVNGNRHCHAEGFFRIYGRMKALWIGAAPAGFGTFAGRRSTCRRRTRILRFAAYTTNGYDFLD